ncbi:MAG: PepSY-like domain-containing protein, partial [Bacteroidota bacterium]
MKKVIILTIAIGFALVGYSQKVKDSDVPAAVRDAFGKAFPKATGVKWSKEGANEFESEFKVGKEEKSAVFDNAGVWLNTETEIETSDLPTAVQSSIKKQYPDYKIEEAEVLETPDGVKLYEVEVKKGSTKHEVVLSADGTITKTS